MEQQPNKLLNHRQSNTNIPEAPLPPPPRPHRNNIKWVMFIVIIIIGIFGYIATAILIGIWPFDNYVFKSETDRILMSKYRGDEFAGLTSESKLGKYYLKIISPEGGKVFCVKDKMTIEFESKNIELVKIILLQSKDTYPITIITIDKEESVKTFNGNFVWDIIKMGRENVKDLPYKIYIESNQIFDDAIEIMGLQLRALSDNFLIIDNC